MVNKETKETDSFFGFVGHVCAVIAMFICFFVITGLIVIPINNALTEKDCKTFSVEQNIKTEISQSSGFEEKTCYILFKDGTKIDKEEFNIALIKEPIKLNE